MAAGIIKNGTVMTAEAKSFDQYKRLVGLGAFSVGDSITLQGKQYTITGYKPRSSKAPVCVSRDGRGFKVSVDMVKMYNSVPA